MRIKALVSSNIPVKNMANDAADTIATIPKNEIITLINSKKDGGFTYYFIEEYDGYVKKDYLKLLRDEEFYFSSSLLRSKANRSNSNLYTSIMALSNNARVDSEIKDILSDCAEYNKIQPGDDLTVINAKLNAQRQEAGLRNQKTETASSSNSAIPSYNPTETAAKANAGGETNNGPVKGNGISGIQVSQFAANVGANILSTKVSGSPLGSAGVNMLSSFAATGSWDTANNMDLGSYLGNGIVGNLMKGATINNLSDGSFFENQLMNNVNSMLGSYLNTLLAKLDYVVGFNLSGSLLNLLSGFGVIKPGPIWDKINTIYRPTFKWDHIAGIEERIHRYFTYKGLDHNMTWLWGGNTKINYSTGTMVSRKDTKEVTAHRQMYENLYSDFRSSIEIIKDLNNLNISRQDWFINFNRYRLIHPDSVLSNSKGYVFFTRPDLNIVSQKLSATDIGLLFFNLTSQHPILVSELTKGMSGDHQFMPLLSNRCTGLDIQDETLETKETGETLTGWKLNYGMNLIKSQSANTVTTSFIDDELLSVYLLFKLWCEYISAVSRGITFPKSEYIRTKQLDYANSIYYFLTAQDGETLIYWCKYTGCIPTNIPSSNFSDSIDSPVKMPKYSITWQYAFKKDYDPYTLAEFNKLTGSNFSYTNIYNSETARSNPTMSGAPFIDTRDGSKSFKIRFRRKINL